MYVALAPFLKSCPAVTTLGIRPGFGDYSGEERTLLLRAKRIFFPTPRFVDIFQATGKLTFPRATTYRYQRSRILQRLLFQYVGYPHPRSGIYYGRRQKACILKEFDIPVTVLGPEIVPGRRTVHAVYDSGELERFAQLYNPLIVREAVHWEAVVRFLCTRSEVLAARGGGIPSHLTAEDELAPVPLDRAGPRELLDATRRLVRQACLDDIVVEWRYGKGVWQIVELTRPPVLWHTPEGLLNRHRFLCDLIRSGAFEE